MSVFLNTMGWRCIASRYMMRVDTDGVVCAGFFPLDVHQLCLGLHWDQVEGVCAHLVVDNLLRLCADSFDNLITFLLLFDHQTISNVFLFALGSKGWYADFCLLFDVVYGTFLPVVFDARPVGSWRRWMLMMGCWMVGLGMVMMVNVGLG